MRKLLLAAFLALAPISAMAQMDASHTYFLRQHPAPIICGSEERIRTYFREIANGQKFTVFDLSSPLHCDIALIAILRVQARLDNQSGAFCQIDFPFDPQLRGKGYAWVYCADLVDE